MKYQRFSSKSAGLSKIHIFTNDDYPSHGEKHL